MAPESHGSVAIVTARNEADRIGSTVAALLEAVPGCHVIVADDGSDDETSLAAMRAGAEVVARGRPHGKGGAATAAAESVLDLARGTEPPVFVLCDGDLGESAGRLSELAEAVASDRCDVAIAAFARKQGGGLGIAVGFARWAIERLTGRRFAAPISGQRALSGEALLAVVPFARGFGMEIGITVDALRARLRVEEFELDLEHRATGRDWRGFVHRGRQLVDFTRVYMSRRRRR